jgi:hypothetical protein
MLCGGVRDYVDDESSAFYGTLVFKQEKCAKLIAKEAAAAQSVGRSKMHALSGLPIGSDFSQYADVFQVSCADKVVVLTRVADEEEYVLRGQTITEYVNAAVLACIVQRLVELGITARYQTMPDYLADTAALIDISDSIDVLVIDNWNLGGGPSWAIDSLVAVVDRRNMLGMNTIINLRVAELFHRSQAEELMFRAITTAPLRLEF